MTETFARINQNLNCVIVETRSSVSRNCVVETKPRVFMDFAQNKASVAGTLLCVSRLLTLLVYTVFEELVG